MPRNRTRGALLAPAFALLVTVLVACIPAWNPAATAAAVKRGQRPSSLPSSAPAAASTVSRSFMVQVSSLSPTYSPATLAGWIQEACARTQGAAPRDLVLQDIADSDGKLASAYLDAILPFLPGGAQPCFGRVFVGTVDLAWTGEGSKYVEGVGDGAFRDRYLAGSKALASAFVARYPNVPVNWYLTYEANLNDFFYPAVASAYRSLFTAEMQALSSLRPSAVFAWSPAFWYPYSAYHGNVVGMTQLEANLRDFFASLRRDTAGIQLLDLQDFVAGSGCQPTGNQMTADDAVNWTRFLIRLQQVPEVAINVEQYAVECSTGAFGPGNPQEIQGREALYASHALTLGPAFELRYWMQTHPSAL